MSSIKVTLAKMSPILGVLLLKYTFAGIYLSLDGVNYANNSVISTTEIEENHGLECIMH